MIFVLLGDEMKTKSILMRIIFLNVLLTSLMVWFQLKVDIVKTSFFIGKHVDRVDMSYLDESIRDVVEKAGFNYYSEQTEPLSDDETNKLFG